MAVVLISGAAAGAAFQMLFDTVIKGAWKMKKQYTKFKPSLQRLEDMLISIQPDIKRIAAYNQDFDRPDDLNVLKELLERGDRLVRKCSTINRFNFLIIASHSRKILKLEEMIRNHISCKFQIEQSADLKENLFETRMNGALLCETSKDVKKLVEQVSILSIGSSFAAVGSSSRGGSMVGRCSPPGLKVKPVGLEVPLRDLKIKLLKDDLLSLIVVSAPGGFGKTTLATALCHDSDVQDKFKGNIFFITVSKQPKLLGIIEILLQHKDYMVREFHSEEDGVNQLEWFLRQMAPDPILLVLDDVWSGSEDLLERLNFGIENFKILVTSRSEFPRFSSTYKLGTLKFTDAMALFQQSALLLDGKSYTPDLDTMTKIVQGCKGFPLAISVIGRSLRGKRRAEWLKRLQDCSKAASILSESELLDRLQISVDALDDNVEVKECYMDLGSFPEDQRIPVTTLIDMWVELHNLKEVDAVVNLYELADRNLIDLVVTRKDAADADDWYSDIFFKQHDLLRELAILQSNSDCIELRKRLFVEVSGNRFPAWWMEQRELKAKLLSISTDEMFLRWESIEAPEVEILFLNFQSKTCTLPEFMGGMQKLKVLTVTNYGFFQAALTNVACLDSLYNLKRIRLEKVSLPSSFLSSVRLEQLKKMSLVMCNVGEAFSSITVNIAEAFPRLAEMNIDYCKDLTELPSGFCDLSLLEKLSITNCHKLSALPDGIGRLVNMKELRLNSCIELLELPETIGGLQRLKILDLSDCLSVTELPEQIGELSNLRTFYMIECSSCELPSSVINLVHLREVICDEETANAWRIYGSYLSSLKIKEHKDINLDWLDNHCFF